MAETVSSELYGWTVYKHSSVSGRQALLAQIENTVQIVQIAARQLNKIIFVCNLEIQAEETTIMALRGKHSVR
jgi:hypothetical protein